VAKNSKKATAGSDQAENVAIAALSFIAADPERLGRFLAVTGIGPADIRIAARAPLFLAGVIGHIAGDEKTLLAFAAESGLSPAEIERARHLLAGPDWERDAP
jgi:hypothetical protein